MKTKNQKSCIAVFTICVLAVLPIKLYAQALTLDQLISFQKKNVSEINDILISKGWNFNSSTDETEDDYGETIWSFSKSRCEDNTDETYLTLWFGSDYPNQIGYQTSSKSVYLSIKESIIKYGMKIVNSKVGDDQILTDYQGKNYTVRIEYENKSTYSITIYTNSFYETKIESKTEVAPEDTDLSGRFFIGEKSYPCTESYNLGDLGFGGCSVLLAKDGQKCIFAITTGMERIVVNTIILYLDDNSLIKLYDRKIRDCVNSNCTAVYYLTIGEIKKIQASNIATIRYTVAPSVDRFTVVKSFWENCSVKNEGGRFGSSPRIDFPTILKNLFE